MVNGVASSGAQMGNLFQYFIFITFVIKNSASQSYKIEATLLFSLNHFKWIEECQNIASMPQRGLP